MTQFEIECKTGVGVQNILRVVKFVFNAPFIKYESRSTIFFYTTFLFCFVCLIFLALAHVQLINVFLSFSLNWSAQLMRTFKK